MYRMATFKVHHSSMFEPCKQVHTRVLLRYKGSLRCTAWGVCCFGAGDVLALLLGCTATLPACHGRSTQGIHQSPHVLAGSGHASPKSLSPHLAL